MKKCFKCGETKPLDDFYKHPQMGDGHLNKCKRCTKADVSSRYEAIVATPEGRGTERARGRDKYRRLYAAAPRTAKGHTTANREWRARNPDKRRAHYAVASALRDGRLVKGPCEVCGIAEVEGHHDDYSKPLEVRWLCTKHHAEHHWKTRAA